MYRAYIIDRTYRRIFESRWVKNEVTAERLLVAEYKRRGLNPEDPQCFGSGIEYDGPDEDEL